MSRPQTSQGFRAKRYRRSLPFRPSQSADILMMDSMAGQHRNRSLQSPIEDGPS